MQTNGFLCFFPKLFALYYFFRLVPYYRLLTIFIHSVFVYVIAINSKDKLTAKGIYIYIPLLYIYISWDLVFAEYENHIAITPVNPEYMPLTTSISNSHTQPILLLF
jgi:hypothetical protein